MRTEEEVETRQHVRYARQWSGRAGIAKRNQTTISVSPPTYSISCCGRIDSVTNFIKYPSIQLEPTGYKGEEQHNEEREGSRPDNFGNPPKLSSDPIWSGPGQSPLSNTSTQEDLDSRSGPPHPDRDPARKIKEKEKDSVRYNIIHRHDSQSPTHLPHRM